MLQTLHRQHTPDLHTMLADLGSPNVRQLGKALGVSPSTAARWIKTGEAPRPAMLALFWLTRWGVSQINCQAQNDAIHQAQLAACYRGQLEEACARLMEAQAKLEHLSRIGHFGAANDPMHHARALVPVLPMITVPGEPQQPPKAQRKKTASQKRAELAAQRLAQRAEGPPRPFDFLRAERATPPESPQSNQPAPIETSIENRPVEPGQPSRETMKTPYVRKAQEKRRSRWQTDSGFRLIRCFSADHNADRFRLHVTRELKQDRRTQSGRLFFLKMRRRAAARRGQA